MEVDTVVVALFGKPDEVLARHGHGIHKQLHIEIAYRCLQLRVRLLLFHLEESISLILCVLLAQPRVSIGGHRNARRGDEACRLRCYRLRPLD